MGVQSEYHPALHRSPPRKAPIHHVNRPSSHASITPGMSVCGYCQQLALLVCFLPQPARQSAYRCTHLRPHQPNSAFSQRYRWSSKGLRTRPKCSPCPRRHRGLLGIKGCRMATAHLALALRHLSARTIAMMSTKTTDTMGARPKQHGKPLLNVRATNAGSRSSAATSSKTPSKPAHAAPNTS